MEKNENNTAKLPADVSVKYDLVGCKAGKHRFPNFGELDLTKITLKDAKSLVAAGFPHLKLKGREVAETTASETLPAAK